MKTFFLFLTFVCGGYCVSAQDMTYRPFFRESTPTPIPQPQQNYYQPRQQERRQTEVESQIGRVTAYQTDQNGDFIKIPLKITITTYTYPTGDIRQEVNVTSYYRNNGYGGQWENCMYGAPIQKCQSVYGNEMEQSFMFKANVPMIGWVYFDL